MINKLRLKQEKPVNISILFNINPKEIVNKTTISTIHQNLIKNKTKKDNKQQPDKTRKVESVLRYCRQTSPYLAKTKSFTPSDIKSEQNSIAQRHKFAPQNLLKKQLKQKNKLKKQSMDISNNIKKKIIPQSLYISCEDNQQKPELFKAKITPNSSRKITNMKFFKPTINLPQSSKSEYSRSNKISTTNIIKNVYKSTQDNSKLTIDNLKKIIVKLVNQQILKHQLSPKFPRHKSKQQIIALKSKFSKNQLTEKLNKQKSNHNKSNEIKKKQSTKKITQIPQKQIDSGQIIKKFSSNNGQLFTSEISDSQIFKISNNFHNYTLKTSLSNTQLQNLVNQNFNLEKSVLKSREQFAAITIQRYWRQYRTRKLIDCYINMLNQHQTERKKQNQGNNVFNEEYHQNEQKLKQDHSFIIEQYKNETKQQQNLIKPQQQIQNNYNKIHQFHSYQIKKQDESKKVIEFKKREISKWQQTLSFIEQNIDQNNTKQILIEVLKQLKQNKFSLEKDLEISRPSKNNTDIASFTNELKSKPEKKEQSSLKINEQQMSELRESYRMQNNKGNQVEAVNFSNILTLLKNNKKKLQQKQFKQLLALETLFQAQKINLQQYNKEKQKILLQFQREEHQLCEAIKELEKGFIQIKKVIEKNNKDQSLDKRLKKNSELKKCLSDDYLKYVPSYKIQQITKNAQQNIYNVQQINHNLSSSEEENSFDQIKIQLFKNNEAQKQKGKQKSQQTSQIQLEYESVSKQYEEIYERHNLIINVPQQQQQSYLNRLSEADKQDIFEFIFLDLSLQLCQQIFAQSIKFKQVIEYIKNKKKNSQKKFKGIKTNINVVKQYLKKFINFITNNHQELLDRINCPMGPTALQMLKYMHFSENQNQQQQDVISNLILPNNLFQKFQATLLSGLQFQTYFQDEKKQSNRVEFLKGVIHIHNKAIFDAFNENLDLERPFGIWGQPFPWKKVPNFNHVLTSQQKQLKFKAASDKVVQLCTFVCGIIADKEESLIVANYRLSNHYIQQIKQDRLSKMLANDLVQNQDRWVFYDDEQTEVMVELSYLVYGILLNEVSQQYLMIWNSREQYSYEKKY